MVTKIDASMFDAQGKEIILDADADTSITADTDDQIDIKIGGADIFQMTATALDINGKELILDADADTSITADTDDQIDIRIAGADDFRFTANNMNVLSGSTLTIDSGATITNSGTATGFADLTAIGDGSVSAPSLANSGDTNTGIYFPAADTVGVVAGGVEKFRFGSNLISGVNKNLIINGDMRVNQRYGATDSGLGGANGYLEPDRWRLEWNTGSASRYTINVQPNGGVNGKSDWLKVDVTTADTSPTGGEYQTIHQHIEAQNCLSLLDSSSDFKAFTVSFDVILNGDGTGVAASNPKLACFIENPDGNRHYVEDVVIASGQAAAWERVSFTVPADATAIVNNDTGIGVTVGFTLAAGSSDNTTDGAWGTGTGGDHSTSSSANIAYHVDNYLGITNVQLEVGSVATDFAYEDYGSSLAKCQRYYEQMEPSGSGYNLPGTYNCFIATTSTGQGFFQWNVEKRAAPTIDMIAAGDWTFVKTNSGSNNFSGGEMTASGFTFSQIKTNHCWFLITTSSTGGTAGDSTWIQSLSLIHI